MWEMLKEKKVFFKYINKSVCDDFYVMVAGYEKMEARQPVKGPYFKNHFTLHFCLEGKGRFTINSRTYAIEQGDVFLIPPNVTVEYEQDNLDPWSYVWYEFCGKAAYNILERARLTEKHPVYHTVTENICEPLLTAISSLDDIDEDLVCSGNLYLFLSKLIRERKGEDGKTQLRHKFILNDIIKYIENNYSKPYVTLNQVSEYFHLNKSYLTRIFKSETNITVSKYILMIRINKACELMKNKELSIKTVAYSVGFNDALYFSKRFKEMMGFSPTEFYSTHMFALEKDVKREP